MAHAMAGSIGMLSCTEAQKGIADLARVLLLALPIPCFIDKASHQVAS